MLDKKQMRVHKGFLLVKVDKQWLMLLCPTDDMLTILPMDISAKTFKGLSLLIDSFLRGYSPHH